MKQMLIILILIFPFLVFGNSDTIIYFGPNGKLNSDQVKVIKKEISRRSNKKVRIKTWKIEEGNQMLLFTENIIIRKSGLHNIRIDGQEFSENVSRSFEVKPDGLFLFTERHNNQVKRTGTTRSKIPLIFHGEVKEYYPNGTIKSESVYENNELISNKSWKENGEPYIDNVFYSVDSEPRFLRGTNRLHSHVLKQFKNSGIDLSQLEGRIVVGFVVMENGTIKGIRIEQGIASQLNNIAVQAMNSLLGEWQPARLNGKEVRFYQLFPINFIYHQADFDFLEMKGSMLYWEIN
jgi:hypothetical protein